MSADFQPKNKLPVIIVGGGIGGLTVANALQHANVPFLVLEQAAKLTDMGGGIGLWGPALKALKQLNIEYKLIPRGRMMNSAGYRASHQIDNGNWLVTPSYSDLYNRHTSCLALKRGSLQMALYKSIKNHDKCIKLNSKVVDFIDHKNDYYVTVYLEDGTTLNGSIVIGADGIDSTIRNKLFPNVKPISCGYYYLQGIGKINNETVEIGYTPKSKHIPAFEAWHSNIRFGMVPLTYPDNFWFICSDNIILSDNVNNIVKDNKLESFGTKIRKLIESTPSNQLFSAGLMKMPAMKQWSKGRVVLLGDAVHGMAPNLAQGACLSIEDSLELTHQIYQFYFNNAKCEDISTFLKNYETNRRMRTKIVQILVPLVHKMGAMKYPLNIIRNCVFYIFPSFIKTYVFDKTHQFALGWKYTAPNLGEGLYYRLLNEGFMSNNKIFSIFHKGDRDRYCKGIYKVTYSDTYLGKMISKIFGMPQPPINIKEGIMEIKIKTDKVDGSQHWNRTFYDEKHNEYELNTIQYIDGEELVELFGLFKFQFENKINNNNNGFVSSLINCCFNFGPFKYVNFLTWFRPIINVTTICIKNGWNYIVEIRGPKWTDNFIGLIYKYECKIELVHSTELISK